MFWMCIRIASVIHIHNILFYGEILKTFHFFIILILTPDFPQFYNMIGGNLGSLLYGDVSVMAVVMCGQMQGMK